MSKQVSKYSDFSQHLSGLSSEPQCIDGERVQSLADSYYEKDLFEDVISLVSDYLGREGFAERASDKATLLFSRARARMMLEDFGAAQQDLRQVFSLSAGMRDHFYFDVTLAECAVLAQAKERRLPAADMARNLNAIKSSLIRIGKGGARLRQLNDAIDACTPRVTPVSIVQAPRRKSYCQKMRECFSFSS